MSPRAACLLIPFVLGAQPVLSQVAFPKPDGPHAVGTTLFHWTDEKRGEELTPEDDDKRELMVQLWYPVAQGAKGENVRYLPHFRELREVLSGPFAKHGRRFRLAEVPAIENAPPLAGKRLPLIVFSHGLGTSRLFYTGQILALASHGYVVASLDHTYDVEGTVFPGPRLVMRLDAAGSDAEKAASVAAAATGTKKASDRLKVWAADLSFVVDQLTALAANGSGSPFRGRLDLGKIGVVGHCYGAEAAMLACSQDKRFKACVNQNGWPPATEAVAAGLKQPLLFLWGELSSSVLYLQAAGVDEKMLKALLAKFQEIQLKVLAELRTRVYHVILRKQQHMDFTDMPMLAGWIGKKGKMPAMELPERLPLVTAYTVGFFETHLRKRKHELFKRKAGRDAAARFSSYDKKQWHQPALRRKRR